jgi:ABC-type lipoprotein release transport system permease subunit
VTNAVDLGHPIRDNVDDLLGWYARNLHQCHQRARDRGLFQVMSQPLVGHPVSFRLRPDVVVVNVVAAIAVTAAAAWLPARRAPRTDWLESVMAE